MSNLPADLSPKNLAEAMAFADHLSKSTIIPKDFIGNPGNILVAIQWGMELGLKPMQAMQNIAVINGRPSLWGDAVLAIVLSSSLCEYVKETDDGNTATCRVKRAGQEEHVSTFSVDDAVKAGLDKKPGPWTQYPKRMRQMRARAFALRDVFADVLKGMPIAEELQDYEKDITPRQPEAPQAPVAPPELPFYPDDEFSKNFTAWSAAIQKGRRTPDDIIAMVSSKGRLTEAQIDSIKNVQPPITGELLPTEEGAQQ